MVTVFNANRDNAAWRPIQWRPSRMLFHFPLKGYKLLNYWIHVLQFLIYRQLLTSYNNIISRVHPDSEHQTVSLTKCNRIWALSTQHQSIYFQFFHLLVLDFKRPWNHYSCNMLASEGTWFKTGRHMALEQVGSSYLCCTVKAGTHYQRTWFLPTMISDPKNVSQKVAIL